MASESDQGERSEEATQQRREDFRKRGQVAHTRELASVLVLFASVLLIAIAMPFFYKQIHEVFERALWATRLVQVRTYGGHFQSALICRSTSCRAGSFSRFWAFFGS